MPGSSANAYNPPRPVEVYHPSDSANASIPADIRDQFHRDEAGNILFFTAPPLDVSRVPQSYALGHSVRYLAEKSRVREELERKRKEMQEQYAEEKEEILKRLREKDEATERKIKRLKTKALDVLASQLRVETENVYKDLYGVDADLENIKRVEGERLRVLQAEEVKKRETIERHEREREEAKTFKFGRRVGPLLGDDFASK